MILLILIIPFFSFLISGFFGNIVGSRGSMYTTTSLLLVSFLISSYFFTVIGFSHEVIHLTLASWVNVGVLSIN
jgi:NADH:ubiquinone oxidoreductase subunit 5 (subunit L)/multisubunit Na+/H+ antiporter MnhA subunit